MSGSAESTGRAPRSIGASLRTVWERHRRLITIAGLVALVLVAYLSFTLYQAGRAGNRGKSALLAAERSLREEDLAGARQHLDEAKRAFDDVDDWIGRLGPMRSVMRVTPLVRVQLRGVEAFSDAGHDLVVGASHLTDAVDELLHPSGEGTKLARSIEPLRKLDAALTEGAASLDHAVERLQTLDGYRLIGPLDGARRELARRLPSAVTQAHEAKNGVQALLSFVGANGPKRFLVLAQNPDEIRPTGGFQGSYGVLDTDGSELRLERFEDIHNWLDAHVVPVSEEEEATAFRILETGQAQYISNTNATIDGPYSMQLALRLWQEGGEAPADGVLMITPEVLRRVLSVLGPIDVADYGETVSAENLLERLDFYTHLEGIDQQPVGGRKLFLSSVARIVLDRLLDVPTEKWRALGEQFVAAFDAHEAMAWSSDQAISTSISEQEWDGRLPERTGDFFADAPYEYLAKNGRGVKRTYDHHVVVAPDGSATVTTTITVENTLPFNDRDGKLNVTALFYDTFYGPTGAVLDATSDPPFIDNEAPVAGHPAVGYVVDAQPLASAKVTVVFRVPELIVVGDDGDARYSLFFRHLPTTTGDVLNLSVELPADWKWKDGAPPSQVALTSDFEGEWRIAG